MPQRVLILAAHVGTSFDEVKYSFVFNEAYHLTQKGIDIHIARATLNKTYTIITHGIKFYNIQNIISTKVLFEFFKNLRNYTFISLFRKPSRLYFENIYSLNAVKIAKRIQPEIIHAHFAYPEGFVGLNVKKALKKPLVITVHGYDILIDPKIKFGLRLSKRYDSLIRKVLKQADAIIANSNTTFNEILDCGIDPDKVHMIPLGVDTEYFSPNVNGEHIKAKYNAEDKSIVFTLKAHEPRYRIEDVIRAAKIVISEHKDTIFIIGGTGSLKPYHVSLAKKLGILDKIIFIDKIPYKELPLYYAACEIFVNPALAEGFGLVTAEAMASGKPIVAVRRHASAELVIDGYNGLIAKPMNYRDIAAKILWLLENPRSAKRMGRRGRILAERKYNIKKRIKKIIQLYNEIT